jgi:predicted PurR-regulated permease PerM
MTASASDRFASRVFALVSIAIIVWLLARILRPFVGPLVWSALIAFGRGGRSARTCPPSS